MEPLVNHFLPGLATLSAKELENCIGLLGGNLKGHYSGYDKKVVITGVVTVILFSSQAPWSTTFILLPQPPSDGWGRRDQKSRQLLSLEPRSLNGQKVQSVDEQAGPGAARAVHRERKRKVPSGKKQT